MEARTRTVELPHAALTERILGCFFEVFGELGHGFSEAVLRNAMAVALMQAGMRVRRESRIEVHFRDQLVGVFYADLIVQDTVLVEIKATTTIEPYAQAQVLNYLKACGGGVGLLLNFGRRPEFKRFVMGDPTANLPHLKR
jgi:GxxExxY protein